MIRSTNTTTKFLNTNKKNNLNLFIDEYKNTTKIFIDILWDEEKIPKLLPKEYTDKVKEQTWLSARAIQCCGKQACAIVRGTKKKNKQRKYRYEKLLEENKIEQANKLKKIIEKYKESKPNINKIYPELDSRFITFDLNNKTSFDGWVTINSIGNKQKIIIPFKRTKHFNKLYKKGDLKKGIRLFKHQIEFNFELPDKHKKDIGNIVGLDIGIKKVYTTSDNEMPKQDKHGWNLTKIQNRLCKRIKGSKGFKRAQEHRKNYINWSLNQLNLDNIKVLNVEDIKDMRRCQRTSKFLSSWTYTDIKDKIEKICEESGVQILYKSPTYTSQRCSKCGWVQKSNRKGELFKCRSCGLEIDADYNASINLSLDLPVLGKDFCLSKRNLTGFFWTVKDFAVS